MDFIINRSNRLLLAINHGQKDFDGHRLKVQISKREVFDMANASLTLSSALRTYQRLLNKKRVVRYISYLQLIK